MARNVAHGGELRRLRFPLGVQREARAQYHELARRIFNARAVRPRVPAVEREIGIAEEAFPDDIAAA